MVEIHRNKRGSAIIKIDRCDNPNKWGRKSKKKCDLIKAKNGNGKGMTRTVFIHLFECV